MENIILTLFSHTVYTPECQAIIKEAWRVCVYEDLNTGWFAFPVISRVVLIPFS